MPRPEESRERSEATLWPHRRTLVARRPRRRAWRAARLALGLIPLVAALAAWLLVRRAREDADWARARERLAASDPASAALFEALRGTRFDASSGGAVARALSGVPPSSAPDRRALDALGVPLVGLIEDALRAGRLEAGAALAALASAAGQPIGGLYLAAVELERGQDDGARARLATQPDLVARLPLGRALAQALEQRARGAVRLLRDRHGAPLGALDARGAFTPHDALAEACVPAEALAAVARAPLAAGARLTIDLGLCAAARSALGQRRGSIVLLDVETGAVRVALADETTRRREPQAAFTQLREPASTAKLLTTTAALRAGLDPDDFLRWRACRGSQHYDDGTLWCPAPARVFGGLARPLAISCNVAFADLAQALGRDALLAEYRRFGFALGGVPARSPLDHPHAAEGDGGSQSAATGAQAVDIAPDAAPAAVPPGGAGAWVLAPEGGARQLADLSIGLQDVAVTPLYGARFAAVFARGTLPPVTLVEALDGALGRSPRALAAPPPEPVLDPAWLPRLWPAMQAVAEWGTAAGVAPPAFPVAMKTGTASQFGVGYHSVHMGVGPLPRPRLAFSVRVTHLRTSPRAGAAAREVTSRLLAALAEAPGLR